MSQGYHMVFTTVGGLSFTRYHKVFTTVGGLSVTRISQGFYHCWWTVIHKDITRFLPLLVDWQSQGYHKVFTTVGGLSVTRISQGLQIDGYPPGVGRVGR